MLSRQRPITAVGPDSVLGRCVFGCSRTGERHHRDGPGTDRNDRKVLRSHVERCCAVIIKIILEVNNNVEKFYETRNKQPRLSVKRKLSGYGRIGTCLRGMGI